MRFQRILESMKDTSRVDWPFVVAATLVLTCLFTIQSLNADGTVPFGVVHKRQAILWGVWLALTPAVVATARRFPFGEGTRTYWLSRHVLLGALFAGIGTLLVTLFRIWLGVAAGNQSTQAQIGAFASSFAGGLLLYSLIAFSYQALAYHRVVRERDALATQLRADLAEARLANMEGRLHPHFLFNTLNSIAALVREDPRAAETMVEQLSDLLRASLNAHPMREVSLQEELQLTEQYLAIQTARFQERLSTSINATTEARRALVPQLLLQPLVENAVRHGIASRESGGSLRVTAAVNRQDLIMTVEDDGVGMGNAPAEQTGSGLGLTSVRSRLAHLYGTRQTFDITDCTPSGTRVTIALPYRVATA